MNLNNAFNTFYHSFAQLSWHNQKYILHKNGSYCNGSADWECKYRRALSCPFRLKTEKDGNAIWMYDPKVHTCDPDPIDLVHRFKLQVKKK